MGYIKQQIYQLSKEARSKKQARIDSEQWFNDSLRKRSDKNIQLNPKPFLPGKIYVFDYVNPVTKDTLEWWDKRPVVLALNPIDSTTDCGINLNLLPIMFKEQLLDAFYEAFKSPINAAQKGLSKEDAMKQRALVSLRYENVKKYLDKFGFGFAIRRYKTNLKRRQAVVSYESWPKIVLCDFIKLNGATVWAVKRMFAEYNIKRQKE